MKQMQLLHDGEGGTLFVHPTCGATVWWDERLHAVNGRLARRPITDHRCDVCDPEDAYPPDGLWTPVWVQSVAGG